ncbi:MAG: Dabb family protein [Chitinophagaceae bacterium]
MIRHTVVFTLKYPPGSEEEKSFFEAASQLAGIPGVGKFESLRQISKKNQYAFGFSMEFENAAVYDAYNRDALHVRFIEEYWVNAVTDFMEIDYEIMSD